MKDPVIKMFGDTFTEFNTIVVNVHEMHMLLYNNYEQKRLYELFTFLMNKGHKLEAAELWNDMIKKTSL